MIQQPQPGGVNEERIGHRFSFRDALLYLDGVAGFVFADLVAEVVADGF